MNRDLPEWIPLLFAASLACILMFCSAKMALAAPFLISDPYPASGPQPTECVYQEGSAAAVAAAVASNPDGSVYCKFDVGSVTRAAHSWQVWARNVWGESSKVPFAFSAQVPLVPTGLRVTP